MNLIKEKENVFFNLISDTVTDIVEEKNCFTLTNLKIKYCFKNESKIKVDVFYDNDNSGKVNRKNSIISFLLTPENELTDVHVEFENSRNFDLNKEVLEELDSKVKEKIDSLFKLSDLTYAKIRVLTRNEGKTSLNEFSDLLVNTPSGEFQKFKRFEELLNQFLQKIVEDYDGLQVPIREINYRYPARIEVWSETENSNIGLDPQYFNDPELTKIISFNMDPYSDFSVLDVKVSLEKCRSNGIFYDDLREEDIKVKEVLPKLLLKADLNFSDVEKWTSVEYHANSKIDVFVNRLYDYLSTTPIINSDMLQYMCFGCEVGGGYIEAFLDDPYSSGNKSLLGFDFLPEGEVSIKISRELIKNYDQFPAKSYHTLLDILNVVKEEIVFLLDNTGVDEAFGAWELDLKELEEYGIDEAPDSHIDLYGDCRLFALDDFYDNTNGHCIAEELKPIEDIRDEKKLDTDNEN